jgi:hypothetical protein
MKLAYLILAALLLTILTSFIPNSLVKQKNISSSTGKFVAPKMDNEYAPLNIDASYFGLWYIIPGTKKYSGSYFETMASSFPCVGDFKYFGYPFATVRDVCSRKETNLITVMMNFIIYLVLMLLVSFIYGLTKPNNNIVTQNRF